MSIAYQYKVMSIFCTNRATTHTTHIKFVSVSNLYIKLYNSNAYGLAVPIFLKLVTYE